MKKILFAFTFLLAFQTAMSQPVPMDVVPGSKGTLPAAPVIDKTVPANQFNGLELSQVFMSSVIFNGSFSFETWMQFPIASTLGGEYYTLEFDEGEGWKTYSNSDGVVHFTYDNATIFIYSGTVKYRLRMHGGDMDGWVSNVITAKHPVGSYPTSRGGWSISGQEMFTLVGRTQMENFSFAVTAYDSYTKDKVGIYDQDSEYIRFQWYRRNPYNWEMTPISGATMLHYAPVMEDVGYQLVLEISGDNQHCSFTYMFPLDVVQLPISASVSYFGPEGFILNTDYVLTNPAEQLVQQEYDGEPQPLPANIVTKKPGQYAVHCPISDYESWYEVDIAGDGYKLVFQYVVDWGEGSELWIREAQLMPKRYYAPMNIKAVHGTNPVAATIDILGRNIDDEWVVKATATIDAQAEGITIDSEAGLLTLGDGYILKVTPADANLATTYYPNVLALESAQLVKPGETYDYETGESTIASYTIEVQADSSPGVADGTTYTDPVGKAVYTYYDEFTDYWHTDTDYPTVKGWVLTGGLEVVGDYTVPATIQGKPVVAIGHNAFRNMDDNMGGMGDGNQNLTGITLPQSVVGMGMGAFLGCKKLTKLDLRHVKYIRYADFINCMGLREVHFGDITTANGMIDGNIFNINDATTQMDESYCVPCYIYVPVGKRDYFKETWGGGPLYYYAQNNRILEEGEPLPNDGVSGDVNGDGIVDVADIASIITVMAASSNLPAADVNGDGVVDVADIASVISIMAAKARLQEIGD